MTEGSIQLTRRASISVIKIIRISNTVIFTFNPLGTTIDNAVVTLNSGESRASAPVRITEERCDSHAVGEASEPFNFIAQVDLGGGTIHPYLLLPPVPDRVPMRKRMEQGCQVLGKLKPLGGG